MKHFLLVVITISLLSACTTPTENSEQAERPNILLIMADDMGYSDLGCYGSEISTPNLDQLANNGLRFTQFYNGARCCPTRASLLTGLSPHRAGMGGMIKHKPTDVADAYQGYLNEQCVTIAEVLRPAGYRTYMTGKWHVGEFRPVWPIDRGFDRHYGLVSGAMNYWNMEKGKREGLKRVFVEDSTRISTNDELDFYSTITYTDKAINYLEDHYQNFNEQPFFCYIGHQAPHWPLHAPEEAIQKYLGKYKAGWDTVRQQRYRRMIEMGVIDSNIPLSPTDTTAADWMSLSEEERKVMDRKMAVYAAQIEIMDEQIGRILQLLKNKNQLENTVIFFLSDNGACAESDGTGRNFRPDLTGAIGSEDSYHSYGHSWANVSNTPFRKFKSWTYEGGTATPFIVHWGNQIKNKGDFIRSVGHINDVMPTCVELAATSYPTRFNNEPIHPLEGKSLLPILTGENIAVRDSTDVLCWEHLGNKAARKGDWKIVQNKNTADWLLFNLAQDRTESKDLSNEYPDVKEAIILTYQNWATDVEARTK